LPDRFHPFPVKYGIRSLTPSPFRILGNSLADFAGVLLVSVQVFRVSLFFVLAFCH